MSDLVGEVTDLLSHLIRNACVNDGSPKSGHESRSAELLGGYLEGSGLDLQTFEPLPGRGSLVARIEGSDPSAPTLMLMGHTDVVPVNPAAWARDPFGGELVDGEVWGRGAIDMLCLTASMAVAARRLAAEGRRPKGTLVYLAVADEEAGGHLGAEWLLSNHPDAVLCDYCITESGGFALPIASTTGPKVPVMVGEKGVRWCTLTMLGTPGHASRPYRSHNALLTAAEVARRLAAYRPSIALPGVWRRFVEGVEPDPELRGLLVDPDGVERLCATSVNDELVRWVHASTHTTIAPTVLQSGTKANVTPDRAVLQVDIRTLPGQSNDEVTAMVADALGDLAEEVEIATGTADPATSSEIDTPLWDCLASVTGRLVPGAGLVPFLSTGATDSRHFREAGTVCYGFGLFSEALSFADYSARVHGHDERIDQASLGLCAELWPAILGEFLWR